MTGEEIVRVARGHLGTRFHHAGRLPGVGLDCAGLIVVVGKEIGALPTDFDFTAYGRRPDGQRMQALCEENLQRLPGEGEGALESAAPGDVLLMRITRLPQHLALVTDRGILHSHMGAGGVVEHLIDPLWRSRVLAAYRYRTAE